MSPADQPASIESLRTRLKSKPEDWDIRLALAEALCAAGNQQQAAMVISTAPAEPRQVNHLVRAARYALALDDRLAMRYADSALAHDESNVEAALLRAKIHQKRGEPKEAYRFALVAGALDAERCFQEASLLAWLASEGLVVPVSANGRQKPAARTPEVTQPEAPAERPAPRSRLITPEAGAVPPLAEPEEPEAAAPVIEDDEDETPVHALIAADEDDEDQEEVHVLSAAPVTSDAGPEATLKKPAAVAAHRAEPMDVWDEFAPAKPSAAPVTGTKPSATDEDEATAIPVSEEAGTTASPAARPPARKRLLVQQLSAGVVAIAVHAALIFLLALLVVVVPPPKVAEIVGVVAPEMTQEQPETKQVMPTAMPSAAPVAAAPARAITAAGISSIALPDFEAKTEGPMVTEIATTDLGASFAMPFAPKATSKVNFFGIKSQGRRVAFLIDAERYMLTDPRGGYPAYEIVKNEIAGMIAKLGLETHFNVLLYEGANLSAFSEKLVPATTANKDKVRDWLYPVNREFEKLGIRPIGYPILQPQLEVEPVPNKYLSGYLRAIQYALETDVDAVFIIASGWRSMETPRTKEEMEKIRKQMRWTEKDDIAWREAIKKGQEWLKKENAARKAKGIPERVIVNIGEVWRDMGFRPPRSPPGGIQITAEEREDQVKNAIRILYSAKGKPKPQINFVIFIGKDQNEKTVPRLEHFENIAQRARGGKVRVLQGLAALKNVTGS